MVRKRHIRLGRGWHLGSLLILSGLTGCGDLVPLKSRYVAPDLVVNNPGTGKVLRLQVVDARSVADKRVLGITQDSYKKQIVWDQTPETVIEDGMKQALSRAGYLFSDSSDIVYRVTIRDVSVAAAWSMSGDISAKVSFDVSVYAGEKMLGEKRIGETSRIKHSSDRNPGAEGERALSIALSRAVNRAVSDNQIVAMITSRSPSAIGP